MASNKDTYTTICRPRTQFPTIPKFRLGDLTAHDQFAMKHCELRRLDQNFFANREIANRVVNWRAMGTRDGPGARRSRWARLQKSRVAARDAIVAAAPPRPVVCGDCETPASRERGSKREKMAVSVTFEAYWRRTCAAPSIEEKSAEGAEREGSEC